MALPSLANQTALGALFSLTATGLYCSYLIPILLRVTVARKTFSQPTEFNLGRWSVPAGCFSVLWATFMVVIVCLPQQSTVQTANTLNYSPIMLGGVLLFAWTWWLVSARHWFKGADVVLLADSEGGSGGRGDLEVACDGGDGLALEAVVVSDANGIRGDRTTAASCGAIEMGSVPGALPLRRRTSADR